MGELKRLDFFFFFKASIIFVKYLLNCKNSSRVGYVFNRKGFCRWNLIAKNKNIVRQSFYSQIFLKCEFTYVIL